MLNSQNGLEGGQDSPTALPTSTSGRVERGSHFHSGSSEAAELHERSGNSMSRSSWSPSTEVRAHVTCMRMHAMPLSICI